jgi:hypothetical protein
MPERSRTALWLTEAEGMRPRDAAVSLGMTAAAVAQLAGDARVRVRDGLAAAMAGAGDVAADCRPTVEGLGRYVTGRLEPDELQAADAHLDGCAACRGRRHGLEDLERPLVAAALAVPPGLRSTVLSHWKLAISAAAAAGVAMSAAPASTLTLGPGIPRPVISGAGAAAIAVAIVVGPLLVNGAAHRPAAPPSIAAVAADAPAARITEVDANAIVPPVPPASRPPAARAAGPLVVVPVVDAALSGAPAPSSSAETRSAPSAPSAPQVVAPTGVAPKLDEPAVPPVTGQGSNEPLLIGVGVVAGPAEAGIAVTEAGSPGVEAGPVDVGADPPEPESPTAGVAVVVGDTPLGDQTKLTLGL